MERSLLERLPGIVADARRETERFLRESLCGKRRVRLRGCEWVRPPRSRGGSRAEAGGRLIQGDARLAMAALLATDARGRPGLRGEIDLIHADLPFEEAGAIAADPMACHLATIVPRLCLMRELLANTGSLYVRPDGRAAHYVKVVLDELFGRDCCVNHIVWPVAPEAAAGRQRYARAHDTLFFYRKNKDVTVWNDPFQRVDGDVEEVDDGAGTARLVRCRDVWNDVEPGPQDVEQGREHRPDALLERILSASSVGGALVADFTAGSGATAVVAERLGRRWIVCEAERMACADVRRRLIAEGAGPFLRATVGRARGADTASAVRPCRLRAVDRGLFAGGT